MPAQLSWTLGRQDAFRIMSRDTYDLLVLLAEWLSAVGTVGAVVVALWLASHQNRIVARVRVSIANLVERGKTLAESPEYFQISATNTGLRDFVISGIAWRLGIWSRSRIVVVPTDPPLSPRLPHRLSPGDTATFLFPIDMFVEHAVPQLRREWSRRWFRLFLRPRLRAGIYISTGEEMVSAPSASVLRLIQGKSPSE